MHTELLTFALGAPIDDLALAKLYRSATAVPPGFGDERHGLVMMLCMRDPHEPMTAVLLVWKDPSDAVAPQAAELRARLGEALGERIGARELSTVLIVDPGLQRMVRLAIADDTPRPERARRTRPTD